MRLLTSSSAHELTFTAYKQRSVRLCIDLYTYLCYFVLPINKPIKLSIYLSSTYLCLSLSRGVVEFEGLLGLEKCGWLGGLRSEGFGVWSLGVLGSCCEQQFWETFGDMKGF